MKKILLGIILSFALANALSFDDIGDGLKETFTKVKTSVVENTQPEDTVVKIDKGYRAVLNRSGVKLVDVHITKEVSGLHIIGQTKTNGSEKVMNIKAGVGIKANREAKLEYKIDAHIVIPDVNQYTFKAKENGDTFVIYFTKKGVKK